MNRPYTTNELFHFTTFANIQGIVNLGFLPRFNIEYTFLCNYFDRPASLNAVPMVCFCDIPPYLAIEHSEKYGKCGIGLSKEWGYKNMLNPVVYLPPSTKLSIAHAALANSFNNYHSSKVANLEVVVMISQALKSITHLACFLKQYERLNEERVFLNGVEHIFPKGRFYDECEWRYVPFDKKQGDLIIVGINELYDPGRKAELNKSLEEHILTFELKDITHIMFEGNEQRDTIIGLLKTKFSCPEEELYQRIDFINMSDNIVAV